MISPEHEFLFRLRYVYLHFLLAVIGNSALFAFVWWLVFLVLRLYASETFLTLLIFPLIFSCFSIFFVLRKRIKLLNIGREHIYILYFLVPIVLLPVNAVFSVRYVSSLMSVQKEVSTVYQIHNPYITDMYTIKKYFIMSKDMVVYHDKRTWKSSIDLINYFAAPIADAPGNTLPENCTYWFAKKLDKPGLSTAASVINREKKQFDAESINIFKYSCATHINYFAVTSSYRGKYLKAITSRYRNIDPSRIILLSPEQGPVSTLQNTSFHNLKTMVWVTILLFFIMVLIAPLDRDESRKFVARCKKKNHFVG